MSYTPKEAKDIHGRTVVPGLGAMLSGRDLRNLLISRGHDTIARLAAAYGIPDIPPSEPRS